MCSTSWEPCQGPGNTGRKHGLPLGSHRTRGNHFPARITTCSDLTFALVGLMVTEKLLLSFACDNAITVPGAWGVTCHCFHLTNQEAEAQRSDGKPPKHSGQPGSPGRRLGLRGTPQPSAPTSLKSCHPPYTCPARELQPPSLSTGHPSMLKSRPSPGRAGSSSKIQTLEHKLSCRKAGSGVR